MKKGSKGVFRFLGFLAVFLIVGEFVFRFDRATLFFASAKEVAVNTDFATNDDLWLIQDKTFKPSPMDLRIMILGDSKLRGIGVNPDEIVSVLLQRKLQKRWPSQGNVHVLNLAVPGNNTLADMHVFLKYKDEFKPQIIILGYNLDDVYGDNVDRDSGTQAVGVAQGASNQFVDKSGMPQDSTPLGLDTSEVGITDSNDAKRANTLLPIIERLNSLWSKSAMVGFVLQKANMELKLGGFIISGSEFDHLVNYSHRPDYPGWVLSQAHLESIIKVCSEERIFLAVYNVPNLEMLNNYGVFGQVNTVVQKFFTDRGVLFIEGSIPFLGRTPGNYALSRYDGHPNAAAHQIIAQHMAESLGSEIDLVSEMTKKSAMSH